jgi:hypothetical protein
VRGGFGLFLGEVLTNAVRHGRPATTPRVTMACDRVRRELTCTVVNALAAPRAPGAAVSGDAYGGGAIQRALARLFGRRDFTHTARGDTFVARWVVPVSERRALMDAD